jgi:hypothetical protein
MYKKKRNYGEALRRVRKNEFPFWKFRCVCPHASLSRHSAEFVASVKIDSAADVKLARDISLSRWEGSDEYSRN